MLARRKAAEEEKSKLSPLGMPVRWLLDDEKEGGALAPWSTTHGCCAATNPVLLPLLLSGKPDTLLLHVLGLELMFQGGM